MLIFLYLIHQVNAYMLSHNVTGSFFHWSSILCPAFASTPTWEAKWQKRSEFIIQSVLPKPDVGPYVKAKLRQQTAAGT